MFAKDRDLLVLEPGLFSEVGWLSQRIVVGTGSVATAVSGGGSLLTMSSQDAGFDEAGVGAGSVVTFDRVAYEVVERVSADTLRITRARSDAESPAIPLDPESSRPATVPTFAPQLAIVHRQVLRMAGIEIDDASLTPVDDRDAWLRLDASAVMNPGALVRAEALGALHLILTAASAAGGPGSELGRRAEQYRRRFEAERLHVAVRVDTDGDGVADATRRLNVVQFLRG